MPSTNKGVNDELEITPITFGMLENIPIRQDDADFAEVEVESDNDLVTIDETNRTVSGPENALITLSYTVRSPDAGEFSALCRWMENSIWKWRLLHFHKAGGNHL